MKIKLMKIRLMRYSQFVNLFKSPRGYVVVRKGTNWQELWLLPFNYLASLYYQLQGLILRLKYKYEKKT
jgi:hypothetical protein